MKTSVENLPVLPEWLASMFPFKRNLIMVNGMPIHLVDEGSGPIVMLFHGNPTWSFLWRKIIPLLTSKGLRVVVPDLPGLGFSHKPLRPEDHSLEFHIQTMCGLVQTLGIEKMVIAAQDWGGPISSGVAARMPEKITGAVFANTAVLLPKLPIRTTQFHRLSHVPIVSDFMFRGLAFPLPVLSQVQGNKRSIGFREHLAYFYPLRHIKDRSAMLGLARMVPDNASHPSLQQLAQSDAWARSFKGKTAFIWGTRDPIMGRALSRLKQAIPHASVTETPAGHFLQEEVPHEFAQSILSVID
ncbi:MAG: alpha/beta fold hydrolase [SAR324 cluster bacterium]|nr:alpha/beta fold hydrolase [SAR324 cluster bacterium]